MTLVLRYAARSDVGRVRAKNDESPYVGRHPVAYTKLTLPTTLNS